MEPAPDIKEVPPLSGIAKMKIEAADELDRLDHELTKRRAERDTLNAKIRDLVTEHTEAQRINNALNRSRKSES